MKFETINNQLCRMVEPEPLTPEANFPCVVRLIQDDSPMGLCNRWKYSEKQDFLKKDWTISSLENNLNKVKDIHYSQFEIIGYPVVDGSAEWAWQMLKIGRMVTNDPTLHHYEHNIKTSMVTCVTNRSGFRHSNRSIDTWGEGRGGETDWQLYEPEPEPEPKSLLVDAQVGDLCKRRDGKWVQVDSYSNDRPCPVMCKSDIGGQDCFTLDGRNHNAINDSKDIIHTEPLAPKGTAEWAWQMLKLGKPVTNKRVFIAGGHIKDTDSDKYHFVKMWGYSGWQLYKEPKPEPEPAFKVGDWVTNGRVVGRVTLIKPDWIDIIDQGIPHTLGLVNLRKLDPSEVVIHIGCLSGTVEKAQDYAYFLLWHSKTDCDYSMIKWSAIDTPTRKLVKALLKAQEEK